MARPAVVIAVTAILLALNAIASPLGFWPWPLTAPKPLPCDRASFAGVLPAEATLEKVAVVREGGSYGEGNANIPNPTNPTNLPALCAVTVRVRSSASSSYRFGLFLPEKWNSRFLVVGNGGFGGGINWLDMAAGPRYGMASLSTDTGHSSSATDTSWALNQPEKKTDWGWRAIHGSTALGKTLIGAYYGNKPPTHSYFSGCSTGGRQGLKELQLFPESFDGALIGAPSWWTSHLNNYVTQVGLYNLPTDDPKHLSPDDIALLAAEVTRQCDAADGVLDGIISSPERCAFNYTALLCPTPNHSSQPCLTPAQLTTARNVHSPYLSSKKALLHPGLPLSSEPQWNILLSTPNNQPSPFGIGYARDFLYNNPAWDWHTFDESAITLAEATDPGGATADDYPALGAFRKKGGKVILYHGLADGLVPVGGTELYFNRTTAALGNVADFMAMFLLPSMQHCWGTAADTNAPWNIGGAFQAGVMGSGVWSVPGFEDAEHDAMMALVEWVERGRTVERVVATTWRSALDPASGVRRQRVVCAWPGRAVWDGVGGVDKAGSWGCEGG